MKLDITYRQIFAISGPIMLGSAAQQVIALSDSVLLARLGESDFAAIGFVGVFYIAVAAVGFGFSRGGQIMIARRMGEQNMEQIGHTFHAMFWFELILACLLFAFMRLGAPSLFAQLLDHSPVVLAKSLEYLHYRSFGIFFSYTGVALIALYTGMARVRFILIDTIILAVVNLLLNYCLIFGKLGFPAMGIAGSGLASTIAEVVAFVVFLIYMMTDRTARAAKIFHFELPNFPLIRKQLQIALPVVAQSALGQGSWVLFFAMVENMGERPLAISNLGRTVFLCLSIPAWGFSSGVNTLVSNLIGQGRKDAVLACAMKTGLLCWVVTMCISLPVVIFPTAILGKVIGPENIGLIAETRPIFWVLLLNLTLFSFGGVFINALAGTGATSAGLLLQLVVVSIYLVYIKIAVEMSFGLPFVWLAEVIYWAVMLSLAWWYLWTGRWQRVTV